MSHSATYNAKLYFDILYKLNAISEQQYSAINIHIYLKAMKKKTLI